MNDVIFDMKTFISIRHTVNNNSAIILSIYITHGYDVKFCIIANP